MNACNDVVQSMTQAGGDKLVAMQRKIKMPDIGSTAKKSIDNAPPWLKADSELNYSSDDDVLETETEKAKRKKAVSESSECKLSSSAELIVGGDNLPADDKPGGAWQSNIQSSALEDSGIKLAPAVKKLDN